MLGITPYFYKGVECIGLVPLSKVLLETLRSYYLAYHPKKWIFENPQGGQYSVRSAQQILQDAKYATGIQRKGAYICCAIDMPNITYTHPCVFWVDRIQA